MSTTATPSDTLVPIEPDQLALIVHEITSQIANAAEEIDTALSPGLDEIEHDSLKLMGLSALIEQREEAIEGLHTGTVSVALLREFGVEAVGRRLGDFETGGWTAADLAKHAAVAASLDALVSTYDIPARAHD